VVSGEVNAGYSIDLIARLYHRDKHLTLDAPLSTLATHTGLVRDMSKKTRTADTPDFEKSLAELEQIVERMEQGELSLDESLKQFERGVALARSCQTALQQAEQKVEILLRKQGGSDQDTQAVPFTVDDDQA
jgi:exodeoxyribonuclease VII small subunit